MGVFDVIGVIFSVALVITMALIGPVRLQRGIAHIGQRIADYWGEEEEPRYPVTHQSEPEIDWKELERKNIESMHEDWARRYVELLMKKSELMTDVDWAFARKAGLIDRDEHAEIRLDMIENGYRHPKLRRPGKDEGWLCNPCARNQHKRCMGPGVAGKRQPCECDCRLDYDDF